MKVKKEKKEEDVIINSVNKTNVEEFMIGKIKFFKDVIKKTLWSCQKYKSFDIIGVNEINLCTQGLEENYKKLELLNNAVVNSNMDNYETFISDLQQINNDISTLIKKFGTEKFDDLITICFGNDFLDTIVDSTNKNKYEIINKYVNPTSYKVIPWKNDTLCPEFIPRNTLIEDATISEKAVSFECFDLGRTSNVFQIKVYGIKVTIQNISLKKTLIVYGITRDITNSCLDYDYITSKLNQLIKDKPQDTIFSGTVFSSYVSVLTIKELLIYSNEEIYHKFSGYISQIRLLKQKQISQIVKDFINNELYAQRTTLIVLLLNTNNHEFQYLAYLLYDLLSSDNNNNIDTHEQTLLYDSLPWNIKRFFGNAMKQTITYTNKLCNYDSNKIPLEQQICLMKVSDTVKEKAMSKLKEIKSKAEDTGSKARQYLDGLLKIPFDIYKSEPVLEIMSKIKLDFDSLLQTDEDDNSGNNDLFKFIEKKKKYNNLDIIINKKKIENEYLNYMKKQIMDNVNLNLLTCKRNILVDYIQEINNFIKINKIKYQKIVHSGKKIDEMRNKIKKFIVFNNKKDDFYVHMCKNFFKENAFKQIHKTKRILNDISSHFLNINTYMVETHKILNTAVYGHTKAKRQIERIIGQWINGEKTGYCFGFEGPPGVGKTSLAKNGISKCLLDIEGNPRPFSFIAIGGSSNSSTLDGHNYTYVGSTWGRIVDILIENKCMNPIIFIDELDKVSRTEHGKEIIGILTHLIDPTQNDSFQDKYFSGIDLDLSKALFIFSYNDVSALDRILLDRIHRIKFEHLSLDDKVIITKKHILPELTEKMGLTDTILLSDEVIEYLVLTYTYESGVRKLKELLFEIIGEINLEILNSEKDYAYTIDISIEDIKNKYLKDRTPVNITKSHKESTVGVINGLWANSYGNGGIIPIETCYFHSSTMLEFKLTGLQGNVMQESMNVSKTLAWSLLTSTQQKKISDKLKKSKEQGIHIHCPEGAVPKDGPSAGAAITTVIYSLLTNKKIKNYIGITGEIDLRGKITAIGGLDLKIVGGIYAGIKHFIFPNENKLDFDKFKEKYENNKILNGIDFTGVDTIQDVMEIIFDEE